MDALKIIIGRSNHKLGEAITRCLGIEPTDVLLTNFADGEIRVQILENVRGKDVFIIQSTQPPADNLLELLLLLDAAKRASARRVTAVIPYFGYARQERKDRPRVPISTKLVANLIVSAGVDRVLTMDLHAPAIQGFFDVPTDHLISDLVFAEYIRATMQDKVINGEIVIVSPDIGGVRRIDFLSGELGANIAIINKKRTAVNKAEAQSLIGAVKGKTAIIRDDIVDTAGTIKEAAELLKQEEHGAKSVYVLATHPLFSPPAVERISTSQIDNLVVTDTIPLKQDAKQKLTPDIVKVISVAPLFATAIKCIHEERSLSVLFQKTQTLNL
mgnify:CR=1 FL=1